MADSNIIHKLYGEHLGNSHVNKFIGHRGEIFYDPDVGELRLGDSHTQGGISLFKALASNFGVSADGGNTISNDFVIISYDGGNATSPFDVYDQLDGNGDTSETNIDVTAHYTFTNTIAFSNTINVTGVKAGGTQGTPGQVLTSTGNSGVVWANSSGGVSLPTNAVGALTNDGSGNLSWSSGGGSFSSVDYGGYPTSGNQELVTPATKKYHLLVNRSGGGRYTVSGTSWTDGDTFTVATVFGSDPSTIEMWFDALQIYVAGSSAYQTKGCAVVPFGNAANTTKTTVTFTWVNGTWHSDSDMVVTQVI